MRKRMRRREREMEKEEEKRNEEEGGGGGGGGGRRRSALDAVLIAKVPRLPHILHLRRLLLSSLRPTNLLIHLLIERITRDRQDVNIAPIGIKPSGRESTTVGHYRNTLEMKFRLAETNHRTELLREQEGLSAYIANDSQNASNGKKCGFRSGRKDSDHRQRENEVREKRGSKTKRE